MEIDTLLSGSRWRLIECLATRPASPLDLSKQIGTTVANVSAQLRLLEAAGIVVKERTGLAEAGKPRILYSLKEHQVFVARLGCLQASKGLSVLSRVESLFLGIMQLDLPEKNHVYAYVVKHAKLFERATAVGVLQQGKTTVFGVIGDSVLPSVETKSYKIVARKVSTLDNFSVKVGGYV